jgi:hypothetical protein
MMRSKASLAIAFILLTASFLASSERVARPSVGIALGLVRQLRRRARRRSPRLRGHQSSGGAIESTVRALTREPGQTAWEGARPRYIDGLRDAPLGGAGVGFVSRGVHSREWWGP